MAQQPQGKQEEQGQEQGGNQGGQGQEQGETQGNPLSPHQRIYQIQPTPVTILPAPATIAKPTLFTGKPKEDAQEWLDHFENIAAANEWDDQKKLRVIPVYLYGSAKRWYDVEKNNIVAWTGLHRPVATTFTYEFIAKFVSERKKTNWVRDFDQLKQGRKTIEEYTDKFT